MKRRLSPEVNRRQGPPPLLIAVGLLVWYGVLRLALDVAVLVVRVLDALGSSR